MNTTTQRNSSSRSTCGTLAFLAAMAGAGLVLQPGASVASGLDGYYEKQLLRPGEFVLQQERRGRVTIYDGLEHSVVDFALDTQFDRIGSMMFIRTQETQQDGTVEADDDC
jgi:hypothetical protein